MEVTAEGIETPEELARSAPVAAPTVKASGWANRWHVPSSRGRQPGAKQTPGPQRDVSFRPDCRGSEQVF